MPELPAGPQRVKEFLDGRGYDKDLVVIDESCATAQGAADGLGVELGQIVKSIIFRRKADDAAVLVMTSGSNRVDEKKVSARVGKVGKADAAFVKAKTGFTIGGVAPVAHAEPPVVLIDQDLAGYDVVWAAAGHPAWMFAVTPEALVEYTGAPLADVAV
ncbi:MAG: YbaK/EbsC family protein [Propionibacteriaceae bacterium]|jgi:prolyl-tRNA editing enzyme YbaK/EbsC (Cys-tRNA(Pro) deacylase)|nr:YbaK/EbsC family protein [Propionibacteriaceae bacterium]